jgi:hypothetical protein
LVVSSLVLISSSVSLILVYASPFLITTTSPSWVCTFHVHFLLYHWILTFVFVILHSYILFTSFTLTDPLLLHYWFIIV